MKTIAAILVLAATAGAAEPKIHRGLPYAKPGSALQTLDVYAPAEGKGLPVAVWIHGGGWHRGDKSEVDNKPQALLDRGFVLVSIKAQSQRLVKALAEAGIPARAYPAAGKDHTTINADLGLPGDRATQELFAFLRSALAN